MRIVVLEDDFGTVWSVEIPETHLEMMRGLLGREGLGESSAMLFPRTKTVHTMGMRFPISVAFLDREFAVLSVVRARPGRPFVRNSSARHVLELRADTPVTAGTRFTVPGGALSAVSG